jgi:hypothetical protein
LCDLRLVQQFLCPDHLAHDSQAWFLFKQPPESRAYGHLVISDQDSHFASFLHLAGISCSKRERDVSLQIGEQSPAAVHGQFTSWDPLVLILDLHLFPWNEPQIKLAYNKKTSEASAVRRDWRLDLMPVPENENLGKRLGLSWSCDQVLS